MRQRFPADLGYVQCTILSKYCIITTHLASSFVSKQQQQSVAKPHSSKYKMFHYMTKIGESVMFTHKLTPGNGKLQYQYVCVCCNVFLMQTW